jgi:peptidoglycan hydrolase CwlO-like protein
MTGSARRSQTEEFRGYFSEGLNWLRKISNRQEQMTLSIAGLQTGLTQLQTQVVALQAAEVTNAANVAALGTAVAAETAAINQALADLAVQAGSGAGIQQSDIDALTAQVTTSLGNISTAVTSLQADTSSEAVDSTAIGTEAAAVTAADPGAPATNTTAAPAAVAPAAASAPQGPLHGQ